MSKNHETTSVAGVAVLTLMLTAVPAIAGDNCDMTPGVGLASLAFWRQQGSLAEDGGGTGCHVAQIPDGAGWLEHEAMTQSSGLEVEFEIFLENLTMGPGDVFPVFRLRNSRTGTSAVLLRLQKNAGSGGYRLLISWTSDDASGASHPQIDLGPVTRVRVAWIAASGDAPSEEPDGLIAVWFGDDPLPVFSRQDLRIVEQPIDEILIGALGGFEAGTGGQLGVTAHEVVLVF